MLSLSAWAINLRAHTRYAQRRCATRGGADIARVCGEVVCATSIVYARPERRSQTCVLSRDARASLGCVRRISAGIRVPHVIRCR
eukprot:6269967-Prymnesium_polylepis.2